jgi:hypothetical protein
MKCAKGVLSARQRLGPPVPCLLPNICLVTEVEPISIGSPSQDHCLDCWSLAKLNKPKPSISVSRTAKPDACARCRSIASVTADWSNLIPGSPPNCASRIAAALATGAEMRRHSWLLMYPSPVRLLSVRLARTRLPNVLGRASLLSQNCPLVTFSWVINPAYNAVL